MIDRFEDLGYDEALQILIDYCKDHDLEAFQATTQIIIMPGYTIRSSKALITNFHQPGSTLLLLVAAFIGEDWKKVYNYALEHNFRFLSYGDSSLLWRDSKE
jgi:S-adenosylmethionine:tRNA ribosyltransferase-isomerase